MKLPVTPGLVRADNVTDNTSLVARSLEQVRSEIHAHELRYERQPGSVTLMAVSKKKPVSAIRDAIAADQRVFGENYVEEGVEKIQELADASLEWHFIGAIQSRKTAQIAEHFDWAHGVDRVKVARRLADQRPAGLPPLNVCLQVNLDNEPGKAGVGIDEVAELAGECANFDGITLRGLMAIPAPRTELAAQRKAFARLAACLSSLRNDLPSLDTLSMGMSADMEAAVAEGATIVRVGTAIFGAREG